MKYSIILPVRNGGEHVKDCVQSILSQSLPYFNLHVLDNQSTDGTLEWITSLQDERIKIYAAQKPLSIEENWGRILNIPKNEFITLIGHDDILENNYLQVMDKLIEQYPDASLYQTHFRYIDKDGNMIRHCQPMDARQTAPKFLAAIFKNIIDVTGTGFMMRSADYNSIGGMQPYPNLLFADFELWINLTAKSYKATALEECFSFRLHESTTATSTGVKFQEAFRQFINWLEKRGKENKDMAAVIQKHSLEYISFYCKGLSHRLIRSPLHERNGLTVKKFISYCKEFADRLVPENNFNPYDQFSVRLAKIIDSNFISRRLFLFFKKIYPKPLYSK